ncbi:hypothetical protein D9615_001292 [Tricholomella constricta]|uniref:RFX-type winged-helix domain-containing protein n=1 Tax=Tricholomella constricta TaxID=117010 RepID=A0A8H5HKT2_9AGAR|nr:hypothetical protein D9615_001292 [Tricholomella constricta]
MSEMTMNDSLTGYSIGQNEGYKFSTDAQSLFSPPPDLSRKRRYALESLFVLRNTALFEPNAVELASHSHTLPLILKALHTLQYDRDEDSEFVFHIIDLYHVVAAKIIVSPTTPAAWNPLQPLQQIALHSTNRSMIIAALTALMVTLSSPVNAHNITANSAALGASVRYLPLLVDKPLIDACLNYLYVHISHMSMAKAFLLHPEMPAVLKLLVSLLLDEQHTLEEKVVMDISGTIHTVPSTTVLTRDHELTKEELDGLLPKPEPQRCYDWMKTMFIAKPDSELTQVDFWNLYKDVFSPYQEQYPLLVASDVIKNVNSVFPEAQAMVLQGPVQRFIVRGVDRRKDSLANERFKCQWDRSQCSALIFSGPGELYEHLLEHLTKIEASESLCLWSTCPRPAMTKPNLRSHILTHLSSPHPASKHPSQSDTITLPSENSPYPIENPTARSPPPPRSTVITFERPLVDPPSTALTALLCIRILFRTSFASTDVAPRADADHFGFPGIVEDQDDQDMEGNNEIGESEKEGERRGRKAFVGVRRLMEGVRIRDEVLMGWITEMVDAGISGTLLDVKDDYLRGELNRITKDACLGKLKLLLNVLFRECLAHARNSSYEDVRKAHALETLSIVLRYILTKNFTGWEAMEVLAGGVGHADEVFMPFKAFTALINDILADEQAPAQFTFEAALLLAVLANFHKSDAAKLNPYLKCIKETRDEDLMRKICWAANFALTAAINGFIMVGRAYQTISDDSVKPAFTMTLGSMFAALRPDRALSMTLSDPPRELFKDQPIEATVILLPIFEFLRANPIFASILLEYISPENVASERISPPPFTILTLTSYLLTHASSTFSPRSLSYANLALNILLAFVENKDVLAAFCEPAEVIIPRCRQKLHPNMLSSDLVSPKWPDYQWKELWTAVVGLLDFLSTKIDSLDTTGGVEQIVRETIVLLDLSLTKSEAYLPSPGALHEFIYELVRSSAILKNQASLLKVLTVPQPDPRQTTWIKKSTDALASILEIVDFYERRVNEAGARTAKAAMSVVAKEIEVDGLHAVKALRELEIP